MTTKMVVYTVCVLLITCGLPVFAYLDRVYRELSAVTSGRVHRHLRIFEAEIEPRFRMDRKRLAFSFNLLARFWLVLVAAFTARGIIFFVPSSWQAALEMVVFLGVEVAVLMQFLPALLLAGVRGNWISPFVPIVRACLWIVRPVEAVLEGLISVLHLSEEDQTAPAEEQSIEALVDAATEEGIIEQDEARLIEQVIEFGEKRVRDVMTPRPDVVAIRSMASLEDLRELIVKTKFSRLPVYDKSLDDVVGVVFARDMLEVPDRDRLHRFVRELMRAALFVPETKFGSDLLKEMQRKNQQMAVVIDEYGLMAGLVTAEDLVEEIVGEIGEEDRRPAPDVLREAGGAMVLRGSIPVDKITELFGISLESAAAEANATTIAGLLNSLAGHVPRTGEIIDSDGLRFEVLEANQRKVLRVRARRTPSDATASASPSRPS
ncbi:MAG TPA: hemolysin family protein [Candidatus Acidoferrales bacterium]|nr:hemolysin family protein [Candidatus Acidoferrales bacterium]